jgi:hypothetical protein
MKVVSLIIVILSLCICSIVESKAAPFIDSIRILPGQPTENDIVRIAGYVATPSIGKRLSIVPTISTGEINISGCYNSNDVLAAVGFFNDTVVVGKLPEGKYYITVRAYYNFPENNPNCDNIIDSGRATDSFYVLPAMPVTQAILPAGITEQDSVKIAIMVNTRNPAKRISLAHNISQNEILISGCFAKMQTAALPQIFHDTLTIGKLPKGKYRSQVAVFYSEGDTNICDIIVDVTQVSDSFTVSAGVLIDDTQKTRLFIYPNPASDHVTISLPDGLRIEQMILLDVSGRVVNKSNDARLAIEELPAGLYNLQVQTNKGRFVQKLQKE